MVKKKVKIPIYTGSFYIFLFDSKEELIGKFPSEKNTSGWCYKDEDYNYVMVIHRDTETSTLVHECVHVVNYIFKYHGVKLDASNDEHQAYFTTWVFEQCEDFIKKSKAAPNQGNLP